jgi:hypothetical protein
MPFCSTFAYSHECLTIDSVLSNPTHKAFLEQGYVCENCSKAVIDNILTKHYLIQNDVYKR